MRASLGEVRVGCVVGGPGAAQPATVAGHRGHEDHLDVGLALPGRLADGGRVGAALLEEEGAPLEGSLQVDVGRADAQLPPVEGEGVASGVREVHALEGAGGAGGDRREEDVPTSSTESACSWPAGRSLSVTVTARARMVVAKGRSSCLRRATTKRVESGRVKASRWVVASVLVNTVSQ